MKNIFKHISILGITALLITSCGSEDDNTGLSTIDYTPATISFSTDATTTTFDESAIDADDSSTYSLTITASLTEAQPVDAVINFSQTSGTADSSDYEVESISIPAGSLTGTGSLTILQSGDIEGDETFTLAANATNFNTNYSLPVTIENDYINDVIDLGFDWSGSDSGFEFCDMDVDFPLYTDTFEYLGYLAATGDCPEATSLSGLADGKYIIAGEIWSNSGETLGLGADVPLTITYSQDYVTEETSLTVTKFTTDIAAGSLFGIAYLEVDGYNYTITEY